MRLILAGSISRDLNIKVKVVGVVGASVADGSNFLPRSGLAVFHGDDICFGYGESRGRNGDGDAEIVGTVGEGNIADFNVIINGGWNGAS